MVAQTQYLPSNLRNIILMDSALGANRYHSGAAILFIHDRPPQTQTLISQTHKILHSLYLI